MNSLATFQNLRPSVERSLKGFTRTGESPTDWTSLKLDRIDFPVPDLLLILLRDVMGFEWAGQGEKVRWKIFFCVDGKPFAVELAKFGLKLYYDKPEQARVPRVQGQLMSALGRLEQRLKPLIVQQIAAGNVTIANRSNQFQARYQFFRQRADAAFRSAKRFPRRRLQTDPENSAPVAELKSLFERIGHSINKETDGFFFSVAMVDSYFSYLEHRLVLLRAFLGTPLSEGGIEKILAAKWDDKLRAVLSAEAQTRSQMIGRLRDLKERVRNPFAHGGTENDLGSIYCHIPGAGAIPGNMSRTKNSAHFRWIPVSTEDHQTICQLFDEVDDALSKRHLLKPSLLAEGGVEPVWNDAALARYRKLVRGSVKAIKQYVEH